MGIMRFKNQHVEILEGIDELRRLSQAGVSVNAPAIAARLGELNSVVTRHLAVENRILYPAIQKAADPQLAAMGMEYQEEMNGIANEYIAFTRRWSAAGQLRNDPDGFRQDANKVLRMVYERLQKENREFYPAIEAMDTAVI